MKTNIKVIATSLSLATSVGAVAGIGGLSVQSHLGQPFSGSIVVSGDEARALIASGSVNVSGSGIRGSIVKQGEDRVVVRLRSSSPVREPVITFTVSAGRQTREYTAFLDPVRYAPKEAPIRQERHEDNVESGEQEMRQGKKQRQRDFIERKKTTAEERRSASSVSATNNSEEMTEVKKTSKVAVSPRRHRAHAGENVANIVERYRPRNMSQQVAVRALMLANPSAFKHGTTIRRNVTLYIPTESQWYAYAQRAQKQVMKERVKQVRKTAPQQPTTVDRSAVDNTPVEPPKIVTPPKVEPKAVQPSASTPQQASTTSKTVGSAQPSAPQTKEVKHASVAESSSQPIKPMLPENASKVGMASGTASQVKSASVVTPPVAASGVLVVKPRPPVQRPPVVQEPVEPVEEETDLMTLGLMGLGGAAVLGGVGYAIMRRRKNSSTESSDEGEWSTEETTSSYQEDEWSDDVDFGAASTRPVNNYVVSNTLDDEYFGDDEFSLDKVSSTTAASNASKDEFSLDNFESDNNTFGTFSDNHKATQSHSRQNDDWAWVAGEAPAASTKSGNNNFVVAEEDEWSMDKLASISEVNKKTEQSFSLDDFVVDDMQPAASTVAVNVAKHNDSFESFDLSDFEVLNQRESSVSLAKAKVNDTFDLDSFDVSVAEAKPVVTAADNDLSFGLDTFDDFVVDKPAVETPAPVVQAAADDNLALSLDDFVVAEPVVEASVAPVVQTVTADDLAVSLDDFVVAEPVAETPTAPVVQVASDEDLSFGLDAFESFDSPAELAEPVVEKAVVIDDTLADLPAFDDSEFSTITVQTTTNTQATADEDLSFGLDAFDDFVVPEEPVAEMPTAPAIQTAVGDDLSFGLDAFTDFDVPAEPVVEKVATDDLVNLSFDNNALSAPVTEVVTPVQPVINEDLSFCLDAFDNFTSVNEANSVTSPSIEAAIADVTDFNGFSLENQPEVVAMPDIAELSITFDVPAVEKSVIKLEAPVITESLDALSLDIDLMPTPPSEPVGMLNFATGPLESSSALDVVNLDNLEVIDDLQGWENRSNENVGFVSGSVSDMTEPLEAKFELAKMYLEIDDAVAARETLRELISESTGNIQEQAKQLLADLGN